MLLPEVAQWAANIAAKSIHDFTSPEESLVLSTSPNAATRLQEILSSPELYGQMLAASILFRNRLREVADQAVRTFRESLDSNTVDELLSELDQVRRKNDTEDPA